MTEQERADFLRAGLRRWGYADDQMFMPIYPPLLDILDRIATALEEIAGIESRSAALDAWRSGQGKHPDD